MLVNVNLSNQCCELTPWRRQVEHTHLLTPPRCRFTTLIWIIAVTLASFTLMSPWSSAANVANISLSGCRFGLVNIGPSIWSEQSSLFILDTIKILLLLKYWSNVVMLTLYWKRRAHNPRRKLACKLDDKVSLALGKISFYHIHLSLPSKWFLSCVCMSI